MEGSFGRIALTGIRLALLPVFVLLVALVWLVLGASSASADERPVPGAVDSVGSVAESVGSAADSVEPVVGTVARTLGSLAGQADAPAQAAAPVAAIAAPVAKAAPVVARADAASAPTDVVASVRPVVKAVVAVVPEAPVATIVAPVTVAGDAVIEDTRILGSVLGDSAVSKVVEPVSTVLDGTLGTVERTLDTATDQVTDTLIEVGKAVDEVAPSLPPVTVLPLPDVAITGPGVDFGIDVKPAVPAVEGSPVSDDRSVGTAPGLASPDGSASNQARGAPLGAADGSIGKPDVSVGSAPSTPIGDPLKRVPFDSPPAAIPAQTSASAGVGAAAVAAAEMPSNVLLDRTAPEGALGTDDELPSSLTRNPGSTPD